MNIEFSIEVWPWVSLLLWFVMWALWTCFGCVLIVACYYAVKDREWLVSTLFIFWACMAWAWQWCTGVTVGIWLDIVIG